MRIASERYSIRPRPRIDCCDAIVIHPHTQVLVRRAIPDKGPLFPDIFFVEPSAPDEQDLENPIHVGAVEEVRAAPDVSCIPAENLVNEDVRSAPAGAKPDADEIVRTSQCNCLIG